MKIIFIFTAAIVVSSSNFGQAIAQNLKGYCLDNLEEGCQDRFIHFERDNIDFCEEKCEFTNPINIRGMDGVLYDFICRSDHAGSESERVIVLNQKSHSGNRSRFLVTSEDTRAIVPCP